MDFRRILDLLLEHDVQFIVVGGVSAVLQGVPTTTFDLDIVPARDNTNRERLLGVLQALDASYREHLPKRLRPTLTHLASDGHLLLMTASGPLDVLGTVVGSRGYDDLLERSHTMPLDADRTIRVLDLDALIELKEQVGREKDLAQLPLLRRTLEERGRE